MLFRSGLSTAQSELLEPLNPNTWYGVDTSARDLPGKKSVRWNGEQEDWMNKPLVRQQMLLERLLEQQYGKTSNPENPTDPTYPYGGWGWGGGGGGGASYRPGYDFFFNLLNWKI